MNRQLMEGSAAREPVVSVLESQDDRLDVEVSLRVRCDVDDLDDLLFRASHTGLAAGGPPRFGEPINPDRELVGLRRAVTRLGRSAGTGHQRQELGKRAVHHFDRLDVYLRAGGRMPFEWSRVVVYIPDVPNPEPAAGHEPLARADAERLLAEDTTTERELVDALQRVSRYAPGDGECDWVQAYALNCLGHQGAPVRAQAVRVLARLAAEHGQVDLAATAGPLCHLLVHDPAVREVARGALDTLLDVARDRAERREADGVDGLTGVGS